MLDKLSYTSNIFHLDIKDYKSGCFDYNGWTITDDYTAPMENHHGKYILTVESPKIENRKHLPNIAYQGQRLVKHITVLMKYVTCLSLNITKQNIWHSVSYVFPSDAPSGWSSNYTQLDKDLATREGGLQSFLEAEFERFVNCDVSPLDELHIALSNYNKLNDVIKDLILTHYYAELIEDTSCFMLLGKILEIIDEAIYPAKSNKTDKRIERHFPELQECFGNDTIKSLRGLANSRKETRHYFHKKNGVAHPSMSQDEMQKYFYLIDLLAVNIARKNLGLELVTWTME